MAAIAGRHRRANTGGLHVLLQGRVDPDIKERADRGAAVRGVSIARYLEILIEGDELADTYVAPGECEQLDLGMSAEQPAPRRGQSGEPRLIRRPGTVRLRTR